MPARRRVHFPLCLTSLTKHVMTLYKLRIKISGVIFEVVWPGVLLRKRTPIKENIFIVRRVDEHEYAVTLDDFKYVHLKKRKVGYEHILISKFTILFGKYNFPINSLKQNILEIEVPGMNFKESLPCFPKCFFKEGGSRAAKRKKKYKQRVCRMTKRVKRCHGTRGFKGWIVQSSGIEPNLLADERSMMVLRTSILNDYISRNVSPSLCPFIIDLFKGLRKTKC